MPINKTIDDNRIRNMCILIVCTLYNLYSLYNLYTISNFNFRQMLLFFPIQAIFLFFSYECYWHCLQLYLVSWINLVYKKCQYKIWMIGSYISKYNPWLATIKRYTNWWNKWTFPYLASRLSTLTSSHSGQTLNIFRSQRVQFIFEMCNNEIFWDNHVGCKYGDLSFIVLRVCKYLVLKFENEKYWIALWKEKNHTLEWIFNEQIFFHLQCDI